MLVTVAFRLGCPDDRHECFFRHSRPPSFVDGDRWAQFDVGGTRVSLAGTDRTTKIAGLMVKTEHLETLRESLKESGLSVSELVDGIHETRFSVDGLEVPVTIYSSRQSI